MKIVVLVYFYFFSLYAGEVKHISFSGKDLVLIEESYNLYDSKGNSVKFYLENKNMDLHFLKTFVLDDKSGDCMKGELENGIYKIEGSELVFYSVKYEKKKLGKVPFYAKIAKYKLQDGELKLIDKKLYSKDSGDAHVLDRVQKVIKSSKKTTLTPWKKISK